MSGGLGGRSVAVTGGGGFIGSTLVRRLAEAGANVRGIDLAAAVPRVRAAGGEPAVADVTDPIALTGALDGAELAVHTAAFVHEWGRMEDFVRVNVGGTANVLTAAARAGVERVVHLSSVVVHGYDAPGEQDESAPLRTTGIPYIDTKSASDRLARRRGAVVIRPGDVYGPGGTQWVLRPLAMAKAGRLALPAGEDGLMLQVYVDDLVEAVLAALERGERGRAYAAWEGEPVTFAQHFGAIAGLAGNEVRRLPRPLLALAGGAMEAAARARSRPPAFTARAITFVERRGTVSTERIRSELGWAPRVPHAEGLRLTEEWLRAEGLL